MAYNDLVWCVGILLAALRGVGGATEKGPGVHVVLLPSRWQQSMFDNRDAGGDTIEKGITDNMAFVLARSQ